MKRRSVISIAGGVTLGLGLPVLGQTVANPHRIGVLSSLLTRESFILLPAKLSELGYREGRDYVLEFRYTRNQAALRSEMAADLVASKVHLVIAIAASDVVAARRATDTVPIIMYAIPAPAEMGYVASLSKPGGNVTGTAAQPPEIAAKILQVLRDIAPRSSKVALLADPDTGAMLQYIRETERAASGLKVRLTHWPARTAADLDIAFSSMVRAPPEALYVALLGFAGGIQRAIEFAARQRLPAIYVLRAHVEMGGLVCYTHDRDALARRTAAVIDRVLQGAKPADIPVEQPDKYELVINMKTAKAMGLKIPQSVLLQATEVIE